MRRLLLLALTALALVAAGCGDDAEDSRDSAGGEGTAAQTTTEAAPADGGACRQVDEPAAKPDGGEDEPKDKLDESKTYRLVVATNCGEFTIELDPEQSPNASASLVSLANAKFFDGMMFHRIAPGFVIQGGDPTGTGSGGPGYSTVDKPPADAQYTKGVVAMAKAEAEPPGTAGSQFYVVTGADAGLPPDYAIVGEVVEGEGVVDKIGQLGDPATEQPTQTVVIESVRVEES